MFFQTPLSRPTLRAALATTGVLSALALGAGSVRLLPWAFDPAIPWRVMGPFARGLVTIALEAAVLVGWPLGWALACQQSVERGEWLALETLGERALTAVLRLLPQAIVLGAVLAGVSMAWGRDAAEPGRGAGELVSEARVACSAATEPRTYAVPFVDVTWLCAPSQDPRLVARAPGALSTSVVTASSAILEGDLRRIVLTDARTTIASAHVHVGELVLRGLPPWGHGSTLKPWVRAALLALSALLSSGASAYAVLGGTFVPASFVRATRLGVRRRMTRPARPTRLHALLVGVAGPLAALATVRALERADARAELFGLAPLIGLAATVAVGGALCRLPRRVAAAST